MEFKTMNEATIKDLQEELRREKRNGKSMACRLGRMHKRNQEQKETIEMLKEKLGEQA